MEELVFVEIVEGLEVFLDFLVEVLKPIGNRLKNVLKSLRVFLVQQFNDLRQDWVHEIGKAVFLDVSKQTREQLQHGLLAVRSVHVLDEDFDNLIEVHEDERKRAGVFVDFNEKLLEI